jgi:hypothetical protein
MKTTRMTKKSNDNGRNILKNCLEHMKNTYAIVKDWMDEDEALWLGSKLGLDLNGELKPISSINMTHPSWEEALDETNPRDTNP